MTARFVNILVATSPGRLDPSAIRSAVEFARTHGARLKILDVVEPIGRLRRVAMRRRPADVYADLVAERTEHVRELIADRPGSDHIDVEVVVGQPCADVIARVVDDDHDLVILGGGDAAASETSGPPSDVLHLMRGCPVPVWVMRSSPAPTRRILALVDPDPDDPVRDGLNQRVLEIASSLASAELADLHVGHAVEGSDDASVPSVPHDLTAGASADVPAEERHGDRLRSLLRPHRPAEVHLVAGHACEVLPELADRLDADLVVMGTVARTGISGLIIGNSAETMLRSVACSVLAVKPDDSMAQATPAPELVA